MLVLRYVTHLLPCPVMCHGDVEKHSKSLWYSELLTTHARKTEPEINCSILHLFAYQPKALHQVILKSKKFRTMKSTFSVIFYLKRQVVKKDGTVPVMGRITVDGSQAQFSCKLTVYPKLWDTKGGRVTGRSTAALETNRMLDKMEKPCDFDPFGQTGLSPFGYNMIDPLKSWCWGSILFYPFKISRFS